MSVLGIFLVALVVGLVVFLVVLGLERGRERRRSLDPYESLCRQLAEGKITDEQFMERESLLREARRR